MKTSFIQLFTVSMVGLFMIACVQPESDNTPNEAQSTEEDMSSEADNVALEYRDFGNDPFVFNIEDYTKQNDTYRTALWTGEYMQLTVMNILPGEDIGLEIHNNHDQFIRVEEGDGIVKMGDAEDDLSYQKRVEDDFAIMIPAGKWHNVVNDSDKPLKLYSIYAPKEHDHSTVHETKAVAMENEHDH